jgi:hypothetical protein
MPFDKDYCAPHGRFALGKKIGLGEGHLEIKVALLTENGL